MPNLIHSLDASSLALLTDKFFNHSSENYFSQIKNIYTIHDCFASTANNMKFIVCLLKLSYISIYTDKGYLKKFNKDIEIKTNNLQQNNNMQLLSNIKSSNLREIDSNIDKQSLQSLESNQFNYFIFFYATFKESKIALN